MRWVVIGVAAIALYFGVARRFTLRKLDIDTVRAMSPAMVQGALHLVHRDPPRRLVRDWIVWWTWNDGAVFSRVVAGPGDRLERAADRWQVRLADGGIELLPVGLQLTPRWVGYELRADEYWLLNDSLDAGFADAGREGRMRLFPDSRSEGPIQRDRIRAHVLFPLFG